MVQIKKTSHAVLRLGTKLWRLRASLMSSPFYVSKRNLQDQTPDFVSKAQCSNRLVTGFSCDNGTITESGFPSGFSWFSKKSDDVFLIDTSPHAWRITWWNCVIFKPVFLRPTCVNLMSGTFETTFCPFRAAFHGGSGQPVVPASNYPHSLELGSEWASEEENEWAQQHAWAKRTVWIRQMSLQVQLNPAIPDPRVTEIHQ